MQKKMSQDIHIKLQAAKQAPAQKWVIQRTPILVGKQHIDARKPTDFTIWPDAAAGVSDTEVQKFWADAARKYGYSSEWDESWVRGSVTIALDGGGAIDHVFRSGSNALSRSPVTKSSIPWTPRFGEIAGDFRLLWESSDC